MPLSRCNYMPESLIICPYAQPSDVYVDNSVKSEQLKWLPNGSELLMSSHTPTAKPKGYTSFSCNQDSLPEFSKNPPGVKHGDTIISKLGPGQVIS